MFGIKTEEKIREELIQEQLKLESIKTEAENQQLKIREFNGIRSICLDCRYAFIEQYQDNPVNPDPTDVICRRKIEVLGAKAVDRDSSNFYQCYQNKWHRKTLNCSDFEKRI